MVKIVDKSKKEIELEKRLNELEKIAVSTIPFKVRVSPGVIGNLHFYDYLSNETMFHVNPEQNIIKLDKQKYFDHAYKVAEAYEKHTGKEWTLKKDYNE